MRVSEIVKKGLVSVPFLLILFFAMLAVKKEHEEKSLSLKGPKAEKVALEARIQKIKESLIEWRKARLPQFPTFAFASFCFLNDDVWAAGYRRGYGGYGRIIHSVDNGKNWEVLWSDEKLEALKVFFPNRTNGIAATSKTVLMTSDGGRKWNVALTVRNMPLFEILIIEDIEIRSSEKLIVRLRGGINEAIETVDGGCNWEYVLYHGRHYGLRTVRMRTQNHGQTWQKIGND